MACVLMRFKLPERGIKVYFAKLKHLLRKAAERTLEATWKRIRALLDCFSPNECQAYLANAGYGPS
jgi:transposase